MTTQQSTRIWEDNPSAPAPDRTSHPQGAVLPSISALTNNLPPGANGNSSPAVSNNRSSDQWQTPPQSARSSGFSGHGSYYYGPSVTSPHRVSNSSQQMGATSHPVEYHNGPNSAVSIPSPGFASHHNSLGLPSINQQSQDPSQLRNSHEFPPQESRRSSLGSQVSGFNNLHINNAGSPYNNHSTNPSQSSIAVNLQRERGIPHTNGVRNSQASSIQQQPTSPLGPHPGESTRDFRLRTAPTISANPMKEVYNAEMPTKGQPYAFPDPDMPGSNSNRSSDSQEAASSHMMSRRDSGRTSITSSIVTNDSRMPTGQRGLDEGVPDMPGTHHHSLQHKQVSSLANEAESPESTSPYSRTPALRNSHKIAERKRRTEMKSLFETLRAQIPASHGSKSSKWEILSKASDHIRNLEGACKQGREAQMHIQQSNHELEMARRELETLRQENHNLYHEMNHYRESIRPGTATAMHPQHPQPPMYSAPPPAAMADHSRSLPPLSNGISIPSSNSMQGVQYSDERR